jgi:small-conductance mechanosensitive channel
MRILFLIVFFILQGVADFNNSNITDATAYQIKNCSILLKEKNNTQTEEERLKREEKDIQINEERNTLLKELNNINIFLNENNVWSKIYSNYETYNKLEFLSIEMKNRIKELKSKKKLTEKEKKALKKYEDDYQTTKAKLAQLKEYKENPFKKILTPEELGNAPSVLSPLDIIKAVSFQKRITVIGEEYSSRFQSLKDTLSKLIRKKIILMRLIQLNKELNINSDKYKDEIESISKKIKVYNQTLDIFKTTQKALNRKISELKLNISKLISKEVEKGIVLGSIILFLFLIFLILKYLVRKYMSENELFYTTNKALNFTFITIVVLILLFSYLENVGHLVTILSFASAGIAIALKDWFMNIMGWLVIIFSGSLHVGDRVKFLKDGKQYVGDIVDISILRMTIHEDVTLTTFDVNRRAGRIIFVPNNYIFTEMIANYSHAGLKTVWDGIDFVITFDSDAAKAQSIAKEVSRKFSKGYTDMTRKQLNKLRSKYSMKNTSVEPRIFAFLDTYGVRISVWYLTNSYATLTLRSTISMEIFNRIKEEDKISMAIPTQTIYIDKDVPQDKKKDNRERSQNKETSQIRNNKNNGIYKPDDWGLY